MELRASFSSSRVTARTHNRGAQRGCIRGVPCRALQTPTTNFLQSSAQGACSTSAISHDKQTVPTRHATEQQSRRASWSSRDRHRAMGPPAIYVALDKALLLGHGTDASMETLRSGLVELKSIGVTGVVVDVWWGMVEDSAPGAYDWAAYHRLFRVICDSGLRIKVEFCFHGAARHRVQLPTWVQEAVRADTDLLYCNQQGERWRDGLSLGVDDVPVLAKRTAIQAYEGVMASFRQEFASLLEDCHIVSYTIGCGPDGELRYPSHRRVDPCFAFHGVGEFQCYDRYMLSSLRACAQRVGQPSWGLAGPHDAGGGELCPHHSGFFNHSFGSWESEYGRFFLQWYSSKLVQHADRLLAAGERAFGASGAAGGLRAELRMPAVHWWYGSASHAAELSAGYYNVASRDGYLPMFKALSRRGAGVQLTGAEARSCEQLEALLSRPEGLLTQQHVVASALQLPVTLCSTAVRFDDAALQRLEASVTQRGCYQNMSSLPAECVVISSMGPAMFEPSAWQRFRAFVRRIRQESDMPEVAQPSSGVGRPGVPEQVYSNGAGV